MVACHSNLWVSFSGLEHIISLRRNSAPLRRSVTVSALPLLRGHVPPNTFIFGHLLENAHLLWLKSLNVSFFVDNCGSFGQATCSFASARTLNIFFLNRHIDFFYFYFGFSFSRKRGNYNWGAKDRCTFFLSRELIRCSSFFYVTEVGCSNPPRKKKKCFVLVQERFGGLLEPALLPHLIQRRSTLAI